MKSFKQFLETDSGDIAQSTPRLGGDSKEGKKKMKCSGKKDCKCDECQRKNILRREMSEKAKVVTIGKEYKSKRGDKYVTVTDLKKNARQEWTVFLKDSKGPQKFNVSGNVFKSQYELNGDKLI